MYTYLIPVFDYYLYNLICISLFLSTYQCTVGVRQVCHMVFVAVGIAVALISFDILTFDICLVPNVGLLHACMGKLMKETKATKIKQYNGTGMEYRKES